MRRNVFTALAGFCLAGFAAATPARADAIEDFYKGKTLSMIVSSSTGGGYDTLARMLTKYVSRHLPGSPNIVIVQATK